MPRKKVFLERCLQNSQENTCVRDSILIKLQAQDCKKETLVQVFSCEFCELSKNTFFTEQIWTTASAFIFSEAVTVGVLLEKVFLKISENSMETSLVCETFKNTFFTERLWTTASGFFVQRY